VFKGVALLPAPDLFIYLFIYLFFIYTVLIWECYVMVSGIVSIYLYIFIFIFAVPICGKQRRIKKDFMI
jgi:hypothetical protein